MSHPKRSIGSFGSWLCLAQKCNYKDFFSEIHSLYLCFSIAILRLVIHWNWICFICLHGVFSLTTQYSFLGCMSFFITCALKLLNLAQTLRLKDVDFWKVKMNKEKLLQSLLNQHICLQTSNNKKVAQETCFFFCFTSLLCALCQSCLPFFFSLILPLCFFCSTRYCASFLISS